MLFAMTYAAKLSLSEKRAKHLLSLPRLITGEVEEGLTVDEVQVAGDKHPPFRSLCVATPGKR